MFASEPWFAREIVRRRPGGGDALETLIEPKSGELATRYGLRGAEASNDPYPIYRKILSEAPVHWNASMRGWVVARYDDVARALCDRRLSAARFAPFLKLMSEEKQRRLAPTIEVASRWAILHDPPEHTRLRGCTQDAMRPKSVEVFRPRLHEIAHALLDEVQTRAEMDLVSDYAFPLPALAIADLLGVAPDDRALFTKWSPSIAQLFSVAEFSDAFIDSVNSAITEASDYLRALLDSRRRMRRDDVVSHLLAVQERGAPLSDQDIIAECLILLVAGHESTVNLIANAALALLEHPAEADRLRSGACRIEDAIEEFLRYDGPSRWITRVAAAPINIGGKAIAQGDLVVLLVGAANRDPLRFSQPDRLDLTRRDVRHLGFGAGIHYCEGAAFGRLGAEVALSTLLERVPSLSLRGTRSELSWREDFHVRSLRSLPVRF